MYRPSVPITWTKKHSNDLLPSTKGSSPNRKQPSAAPKGKLRPWLDLSHHPTLPQVIALKNYLVRSLPIELVNIILSFAEYWPYASSTSSGPRTIKEKRPPVLPPPASAELVKRRREISIDLILADVHSKDNLLVQSAPLGLSQEISQPWVSPSAQHPARMLIMEVTARRIIPAQRGPRFPYPLRAKHVWLDIGVVAGISHVTQPLSLSPSDAEREALHTLLDTSLREQKEDAVLLQCQATFRARLEQPRSRARACLKVDLHVDEYLEGESRTITSVYRFDDHEVARSNPLNAERDGADFVRALRVGDEIGVRSRISESGYVAVIEDVRVTVFWEV